MFREGKLISDLCQRETFTLGIWGKTAHKSQVLDQINIFMKHMIKKDILLKSHHSSAKIFFFFFWVICHFVESRHLILN